MRDAEVVPIIISVSGIVCNKFLKYLDCLEIPKGLGNNMQKNGNIANLSHCLSALQIYADIYWPEKSINTSYIH